MARRKSAAEHDDDEDYELRWRVGVVYERLVRESVRRGGGGQEVSMSGSKRGFANGGCGRKRSARQADDAAQAKQSSEQCDSRSGDGWASLI